MLNAGWEVIRGFLLPFVVGKDYKENWFMVMFRLVGLTFPGVPAHFPTDYVTSVRLGSFDQHPELQDFKDD